MGSVTYEVLPGSSKLELTCGMKVTVTLNKVFQARGGVSGGTDFDRICRKLYGSSQDKTWSTL